MTRLLRKHWVLSGILILMALCLLAAGYLIRQRSFEAVRQLVENLSGGRYRIDATRVRVNLFRLQVNVKNIHIQPTRPGTRNDEFDFRADSLSLNLTDPIGLILHKRLTVEQLLLRSPYLELRTFYKDSTRVRRSRPLHQDIAAMQDVLFKVLRSLQVRQFRLTDGSIAIFPELKRHQQRYFLNHIHLGLDDLHLLKKISQWDQSNRVAIDFQLMRPVIETPDSTIRILLDKFLWQTKNRRFEMSGFDFHKRLDGLQEKTGFRLENIELDSLQWNKLLTQGILELQLLKAGKGYFSSNDLRFRKSKDGLASRPGNSLLEILGSIRIHQLKIDTIEFSGTTHSGRGKESLEILGNNFAVRNLVIDKSLPHKIELDDLDLKVRGFLESDSSKKFQSGFGAIRISGNKLVLDDYFLKTASTHGNGNTNIKAPQLVLINLSIPDLLNGRLKSRELVLVEPEVILQLPARKTGKKANSLQALRKAIRKNLDIDIIRLVNARLRLEQVGREKPLLLSGNLSATISGKSILGAQNLEDLFAGNNQLVMPALTLDLKNFRAELKDMRYENATLQAGEAAGSSRDNQILFRFKDIRVRDINAAAMLRGQDTNWAQWLELGEGSVNIRVNHHPAKTGATRLPGEVIHMIRTGRILLHYETDQLRVQAKLDSLAIDSLQYAGNHWAWKKHYLAGRDLEVRKTGLETTVKQYALGSGSSGHMEQLRFRMEKRGLDLALEIPQLVIRENLMGLSDPLKAIGQATLRNASVGITIKEQPPGAEEGSGQRDGLTLPAIRLEEPLIGVERLSAEGRKKIFSSKGGYFDLAPLQVSDGVLQSGGIDLQLKNMVAIPEKTDLSIGSFGLKTGPFTFDRQFRADLLSMNLQDGRLFHETPDYRLRAEGMQASLRQKIPFNSSREELEKLVDQLPHLDFAASGLHFEKASRKWYARELQLNAARKTISFDSLSWTSTISRDSFFSTARHQADFIQFVAGKSRVLGLERAKEGGDWVWKANRLESDAFNLLVERDKRLPMDSISYRPLLAASLRKIPANIQLGSILLTRSRIQYNEISGKNGREGQIWFSNLNAVIGNIKNVGVQEADSLVLTARTRFMDQGDLQFGFRQSYGDSLQGFRLLARMGPMNLQAISPLLLPLFNLRIDRGNSDSLWLRVRGNDYFAFGHMELDYSRLHFSLLKGDARKRKLAGRLANMAIRNNRHKKGLVFKERTRNKSIFNFWGKIALSGLLNNLGTQNDRKYLKRYRKEALRLDIPTRYFE